nr:type II toxin-antitoxin system PemK/MazF family toxin [Mobiluncus mulieris]
MSTLENPSWAMTEQPHTIARRRLQTRISAATPSELAKVLAWVLDFVSL